MSSETCLSCEGIERYLGKEEERVHALRGVSLDIEPGSVHAVSVRLMREELIALHPRAARSARCGPRLN